ncbi:MAG: GntR family transcriptional regulator [Pseudoflavonifractor sp.]|nr:GntR family transcriptional regulator [Pseudoflavonifractor sp.]
MDFSANKPIYRQIIDICFGSILSGDWQPGQRVPSVRELAVQLAVNSHTVLKAFEYLQAEEIIYPRRGLGFFLADDARDRVLTAQRQEFFDTTLDETFRTMDMLGVTIDDVVAHYKQRGRD